MEFLSWALKNEIFLVALEKTVYPDVAGAIVDYRACFR